MTDRELVLLGTGVGTVVPGGLDACGNRFVLIGRLFIHEALLLAVFEQLEIGADWLLFADGEAYTARRLLGEAFWLQLNRWERGLAGRCLSYLASTGAVPLQKVNRAGRYPNRFRVMDCRLFGS